MFAPKKAQFYNPTEQSIERKRRMAQSILESGKQPAQTEMVSGYAVPQSPLAGFAKALTQGVGGYYAGQADREEQQKQDNMRQTMADALSSYSKSQEGGETQLQNGETIAWNKMPLDQAGAMYQKILMGNPDTAPLAMQQAMENIQYEQRFPKELELARAKAEIEAQYGGSKAPAAIQITQKLVELARIAQDPNQPEYVRKAAEFEYNTLGQTSKSYGWDRGIEQNFGAYPAAPLGGDFPVPPITDQQLYGPPPQGPRPPPPNPMNPMQPNNPHGQQALNEQNFTYAANKPTVSATPGYADAVSGIKGQIKAEEAFGGKQGEAAFNLPKVRTMANEAVLSIDRALADPGLKNISGWLSMVPIEPGGERARADALMDQIGGRAFLAAYEQLKGGGTITEIEGLKGEQAIATLSRAQSYDDVVKGLTELRGVIERGAITAEQMASQTRQQILAGPQGQGTNPALTTPYQDIEPAIKSDPERQQAEEAIRSGMDPAAVQRMYQQRTGKTW